MLILFFGNRDVMVVFDLVMDFKVFRSIVFLINVEFDEFYNYKVVFGELKLVFFKNIFDGLYYVLVSMVWYVGNLFIK